MIEEADRSALLGLRAALERLPARSGPQVLHAANPDGDPCAWLARCPPRTARALFGRDRCGIGSVWEWECGGAGGLGVHSPFDLCWLSLRFDCEAEPAEHWRPFGALRLWTPRLEWRRRSGLLLRLRDGAAAAERQACRALLDGLLTSTPTGTPPQSARWIAPPRQARAAWESVASRALLELDRRHARLRKLVLAREGCLLFPHEVGSSRRSAALLKRLTEREPACWPWLLAWPGSGVWLGATPERLYRRRGRRLQTMALAGTAPRDPDRGTDRRLGLELLASPKDRREQDLVTTWLGSALAPLVQNRPVAQEPRLLRLGTLQHLLSRLQVDLREGVDDRELVRRLHPTPALGGSPRAEALAWLRREEGLDRGLYGGLLGVIEPGGADLHVAIRGALLQGRRARLWAGAGLVPGSVPSREWEETDLKLQALASAWGASA